MLISPKDELTTVFETVKHEIHRATLDKKHPFRFVVLSTFGSSISSRYVVLRKVSENFHPIIYTDLRSQKVGDIRSHKSIQLLFYHPQKRAQVVVSGEAVLHHKTDFAKSYWKNVQGEAQKSYTTIKAPGEVIDHPEEAYEWQENMNSDFFAVIEIVPNTIEVLQLNKSTHLRAQFHKDRDWSGEWMVP